MITLKQIFTNSSGETHEREFTYKMPFRKALKVISYDFALPTLTLYQLKKFKASTWLDKNISVTFQILEAQET